MMENHDRIEPLRRRVKRVLFKERAVFFAAGLLGTISSLIVISIVLSLLAGIMILPVWLKISLLVLTACLCLAFFWKLACSRLFGGTPETTALKLEKKFPDLKGRLIAALQFSTDGSLARLGYSASLIGATLRQAEEHTRALDFNRIISAYPVWRGLRSVGIAVAVAAALLVLFPGFFSYSYKVYSNPTELVTQPLGYKLGAWPGSTIAIKYRDVDLGGILVGTKFPEKATIFYKYAGGIWQKTEIDLAGRRREPSSFGDSLLFYTTLRQVRRSLDYYVRVGRESTPFEHIDVVDRPRVTGIKLSLFYPDYTGLAPAVIDENDGSISAVVGTRVTMRIETNAPVETAEMVFDDSTRSPFKIGGLMAEQSLRVEKDRSYIISLVDRQGEVNPDPIEYYITAVADEYPVVDVIRPGIDINLTEEMIVPLLVRISDDYGFSSLLLKYRLVSEGNPGQENIAVLHFSDRIKTEGEINFNWDVEPLNLMPSDYILYHFEVADNDVISGPKVSKSREYLARLPSLEEIIAQTEAEYGQSVDRTEQFLRDHRDLAERLKNIARKIDQDRSKADQKLAWQHQKELEDIARKEEEIGEQLKETADKINELVDKMQDSRLFSRELLEKLQEIQKLFQEVATPEMKEMRLKLMEALQSMDKQMLDEALKDYQMSQEELMRRLDRALALLKKMKIEQKISAMTEMARELVEKQEKVNENTSQTESDRLPSLVPSEDKVKAGLDNLKNEAANLRQLLKETPFKQANEADKFCKSVESCNAEQNMNSMMDNLAAMQKEPSLQDGKESLSKLLVMLDAMQESEARICQGGGAELARKMRHAIDDINYLSDRQEGLITGTAGTRGQSDVLRDLAAEQQILRESILGLGRRIDDMGKESPFIAAELSKMVRSILSNIDLAIDKLSDRKSRDAIGFQQEALYNLNRAAVNMLDALESQKNCNKGGSCSKPSTQLDALCTQQKMLNQQTQSQCQNPGLESRGGQEALKRLAAEQGAIKKSLDDLQKEFGNSREILGRLDAVSDDMQKVVDQLGDGEVGQETIDRQLKIYSRMLDATKSLQRKDFTEQRKATVGEDILRSSPPALTGNHLQGGLDIDDRLRQFMDESYPEEYEQHIKAYFKALLEKIEQYAPPAINENE
jgi:hypothetical protein